MLDGFRAEISDLNDKVAERAVQLGGTALGTAQVVAGSTKLPAYPTGIYAIADHIAALIDSYAAYANAVRENIDETDEAGDPDTADLFTEVSPRRRQAALVPRSPRPGADRPDAGRQHAQLTSARPSLPTGRRGGHKYTKLFISLPPVLIAYLRGSPPASGAGELDRYQA